MGGPDAPDLLRKTVVSGLGETIGVVVHVETRRDGTPKRLWILEDPDDHLAPVHRVKVRFIRTVGTDRITLKGPREGFHITRVGRAPDQPPGQPGPDVPRDAAAGPRLPSGVVPMDSYGPREFLR